MNNKITIVCLCVCILYVWKVSLNNTKENIGVIKTNENKLIISNSTAPARSFIFKHQPEKNGCTYLVYYIIRNKDRTISQIVYEHDIYCEKTNHSTLYNGTNAVRLELPSAKDMLEYKSISNNLIINLK